MSSVVYGVRELQANLGKALGAARRGQKVYVTSRGKVVAMIVRPDGALPGESVLERKLRRLALEGRIRLGQPGRIKPFKAFPGSGVSAQILRDRR